MSPMPVPGVLVFRVRTNKKTDEIRQSQKQADREHSIRLKTIIVSVENKLEKYQF